MSVPQRLGAGLGCVVVLAALAASFLYIGLDLSAKHKAERDLADAPRGWADSLRVSGRLPAEVAGLRPDRDLPGDGAGILYDSTQRWNGPVVENAYRAITTGFGTADDSATWHRVAADTALDRFVTAARYREWHALDRALRHADTTVRRNIMVLPGPAFGPMRNAVRGLVIRALERQRRGDDAGARRDLGAAVALGEQLFRREPGIVGTLIGRSLVGSGAHGWVRLATLARDSALAARASAVLAWSSGVPGEITSLLLEAPDTAVTIAADTSLSLGIRAEAASNALGGWVLRPRGMLFGPPARARDAVAALEHDRDPDLQRIATILVAMAPRLDVFHIAEVMREAGR